MHTLPTAMIQGEQVEAAFEDLEVGQNVEAVYTGPVAQSYPTQGNAQSIAILEGSDNTQTSATLSFKLTVEGEPPENAMFSGFIPAEGGIYAPLTDPEGDGLYTGSVGKWRSTGQGRSLCRQGSSRLGYRFR